LFLDVKSRTNPYSRSVESLRLHERRSRWKKNRRIERAASYGGGIDQLAGRHWMP